MTGTLVSLLKNRIGHEFLDFEDHSNEESVEGRVVVITGANSGLGKVVCGQMVARGATVIMACRDMAKADSVSSEIKSIFPTAQLHLLKLDLSNLDSVRSCAVNILEKFPHVNILINNAGYFGVANTVERTKNGLEKNLAVNHLGHFLLTLLLLGHLKKGSPSRIVCIGSSNYKWSIPNPDDLNLQSEVNLGLFNVAPTSKSKFCVMLFAKELGKRLEATQVKTYSLCPGLVDTGLFENFPWLLRRFWNTVLMNIVGASPTQGAETVMYCALRKECSQESGKTYRFARYWPEADADMDEDLAKKVWTASEKLAGVKFEEVNSNGFDRKFLRKYKSNSNELGQGQKVIPMILGPAYKNKVAALESIYTNDKMDLFI
ncbi:unnamed protein product [Allacma fusca]|uniref:Protochlorophyllide reductase n=1 Tax=Allacma fusca TaxID=39272 RepID=A0A8J2L652_9HEXA|nr:unnamed protein product [Allacma fusca]